MILAFLFITWRLCDWLIAFFATRVIPYLGFFAYPKDITHFHLPAWLYSFANFDGAYYLRIATHGYSQFEQAFFPLYPLLLNFLSPVFLHNKLLTGLIISYVCFFFGLIIFKKYLDIESEDIHSERSWEVRSKASTPTRVKNAISSGLWKDKEQGPSFWTVIFLLTFPTSFFFGAVYTEGLFFLLLVLAFYFLARKHYLAAAAVSFLAGLTRLNGALLIIPFFITLLDSARNKKSVAASLFLLFSPLAGVAAYSFYLYKTTGDFFFWLTVQPQFGANRSNHLVLLPQVLFRYLKILFTASHNFQYFISVLEAAIFLFVGVVLTWQFFTLVRQKNKNRPLVGLCLFSLANLILPTLTGTLSSLPRYALFSLSFFIFLGRLKSRRVKFFLASVFAILHAALLGFFIQGYFIA